MRHDEKQKELDINNFVSKKGEFQHWRSDEKQKELEIRNFGWKKWNFSTGGLLIGGRPKCLLIPGDHLFLNYIFLGGQWLLINREGLINPDLTV